MITHSNHNNKNALNQTTFRSSERFHLDRFVLIGELLLDDRYILRDLKPFYVHSNFVLF